MKTALGLIAIDSIEVIDPAKLGETDAKAAGLPDLKALQKMLAASEGEHYRIRLHAVVLRSSGTA